jgi:hypothetical protein
VVLAVWGAARQSVTFDENFHLPAGVLEVARGELDVSTVNPPLVKALGGLAALVAGARVPPPEAMPTLEQGDVGMAFHARERGSLPARLLRARLVTVLLSVLLGLVVWRWSRRLWGPRGALVSLGFYAFAPEALAHAGVMTMDVPTALGFTASFAAVAGVRGERPLARVGGHGGRGGVHVPRPAHRAAPAAAAAGARRGGAAAPARALAATAAVRLRTARREHVRGLQAGYLFRTSFAPISTWHFESEAFQHLQQRAPELRLPATRDLDRGPRPPVDGVAAGRTPCFFMGKELPRAPLAYFPVALLIKWPLGFIAALRRPRRVRRTATPALAPAALAARARRHVRGVRGVRGPDGHRHPVPLPARPRVRRRARRGGVRPRPAPRRAGDRPSSRSPWSRPWKPARTRRGTCRSSTCSPAARTRSVHRQRLEHRLGQGLIALREEMARRGIERDPPRLSRHR